ncbi:MAG TPA: zinc-binding dehydrogenase [Burkholderiaceae bacterium]
MKAIVRRGYGGPDQLEIRNVPDPQATAGEVTLRVRAFGINRAEQYFRQGLWGEVAPISGIECVGEVVVDPAGALLPGQRVMALMGGLGRTRSGSYAEMVNVPAGNVVPVRSRLDWATLAALPETWATAWSCLHDNLGVRRGDRVLVRASTSALGQAALALARHAGATVVASVRHVDRAGVALGKGAHHVLVEGRGLAGDLKALAPDGVDAVLDLVGTSTLLESLQLARRGGRVCMAGFVGGGGPIERFDPLLHLPSGRQLSLFASAFVYGTADYPLGEVPLQRIVDLVEAGVLDAAPARQFAFDQIRRVHELLDAEAAGGKMVVVV